MLAGEWLSEWSRIKLIWEGSEVRMGAIRQKAQRDRFQFRSRKKFLETRALSAEE